MKDISVLTKEFGDLSRWQQRPAFWLDKPDVGMPLLKSLQTAHIHTIGRSAGGRPAVPAEQLIEATLLQAPFSIRSARQLCEQIHYNILYRWSLDLTLEDAVWDHSAFTKNRERFAEHGLMARFFQGSVVAAIKEEAARISRPTARWSRLGPR